MDPIFSFKISENSLEHLNRITARETSASGFQSATLQCSHLRALSYRQASRTTSLSVDPRPPQVVTATTTISEQTNLFWHSVLSTEHSKLYKHQFNIFQQAVYEVTATQHEASKAGGCAETPRDREMGVVGQGGSNIKKHRFLELRTFHGRIDELHKSSVLWLLQPPVKPFLHHRHKLFVAQLSVHCKNKKEENSELLSSRNFRTQISTMV